MKLTSQSGKSGRFGAEMMTVSTSFRLRLAIGVLLATACFSDGGLIVAAEAAQKHARHQAKSSPTPGHYTPPPYISLDFATGRIIEARDATRPWYPASVTKLMTVYVALQAVQEGRLTLDTPLVVSARAASMKPSKMGFAPGSLVTLDNALKMLMVKSANDIAITVAEGVSGSVEAFAGEMNAAAAKIGMRESHFVNPNGLPDPNHYSSARDMAILGRALLLTFPQHADLFDIGAMKIGDQVIPNHNGLIGRYPGADGMKTGFTCPAGFNLVASAVRGQRKVLVVVMGDASARIRTAHAADLFDRAFATSQLGQEASDLSTAGGSPPDMRGEICGHRSPKAQLLAETEDFNSPIQVAPGSDPPIPGNGAMIASLPRPAFDPIPVYVGEAPGYQGPVAGPRPANTPIGAIAYTAPEHSAAPTSPIKPDPEALPMHREAHSAHKAKAGKKSGVSSTKATNHAKSKTAKPVKKSRQAEAASKSPGKTPDHSSAPDQAGPH